MSSPPEDPGSSYKKTRLNAVRHGLLSVYTVLPWEDEAEYGSLLGALVEEYAPRGPTEDHLIEEIAGVIWRKRRLRLAEAAAHRRGLEKDYLTAPVPVGVTGIVTNPPFKLAIEFARKALDEVPYLALLLRTNFLESTRRLPFFARTRQRGFGTARGACR